MSVLSIDAMNDATKWSAVAPDGATPSTDLTIVNDPRVFNEGADGVSALVAATAGAEGHAIRRTAQAVDLRPYRELRMSLRADGPPVVGAQRVVLELRLASDAVPVDDAANNWHRLVPISTMRHWETVRFSIDDLPDAVASAMTLIQMRCIASPFMLNIDDIAACLPQMAADCDRAFVAALSGVTIDDKVVTVAVRSPEEALPEAPGLNIRHVDARYAPKRVINAPGRRDYTATGYRETHAGTPYDLDYAVTPVAANRGHQAALLDAVLDRLPPNGDLVIDGDSHPIELLTLSGLDRIGGAAGEVPVLMYRIGTRSPTRVGPPVPEVTVVDVSADVMVTA
jgi:hypothetical protein